MKRRVLCRLVAASSLWPALRAVAQDGRAFRVAWVSMERPGSRSPVFSAFLGGMAALGYAQGRNLIVDAWWCEGSTARLVQLRPDILRSRPDVIVAQGGVALGPMLDASVKPPVVFSMSGDPVIAGIAASYAHPGGNASGITLFASDLVGKRMAMLRQVLPRLQRIGVIANPGHPGAERELQASRDAAARLGLKLSFFPASSTVALEAVLAAVNASRVEALLVFADGFALEQAERIAEFSAQHRIPVVAGWATFAQRGNLLAYGPEFNDVYRRLASYADRIHKGAKVGDLPLEQPTKFELVVNLKTARAIGIAIPQALLLQADEVIR